MTNLTHDISVAGGWRAIARPYGKRPKSISIFRGAPLRITDISFADPFGPRSLSFMLSTVTYFEKLGAGDLDWLVEGAGIDIIWRGDMPVGYPFGLRRADGTMQSSFAWEGYIESFSWDAQGLTVQCKGALYQLDNVLAKPEYVKRPLPYEHAIARQFRNRPSLRISPLRIEWPYWWSKRYKAKPKAKSWEIPAGVQNGAKWTGLLTRSTGTFDPVLTSYVQSMLSTMYTQRGHWTIDLASSRQPILLHRDNSYAGSNNLVVIDPALPGVTVTVNQDFSQSLTTVYGQGTSLSGVSYSGMDVSGDGTSTTYTPLASMRQVWPADRKNHWHDPEVMAREVMLQTQEGLDLDQARSVAQNHLSQFSDPGFTGTITLKSDPTYNGQPILRHLVRAGMDIQIIRMFGTAEGIVARVTESTVNLDDDSVTLSFDSKFRDALTSSEVRLRGRDALQVPRMLVAGTYKPPIDDQLYPWSYAAGSGMIPSNDTHHAMHVFRNMPANIKFPWTEWTTKHPPKNRRWAPCYVKIGARSTNANDNWAAQDSPWGSKRAIPIRMSQAGTIRLLQIAAYDENGNVMKVPFHVSFYYYGSTSYRSMPIIRSGDPLLDPPRNYGSSGKQQHHPFARYAWEQYNPDGTLVNPQYANAMAGAGLVRSYGTAYEKAGYWPGSVGSGGRPTGLLVDESQWSYDLNGLDASVFDPYSLERNLSNSHSGNLYMMIFCEDQTQPVYFLGRMFRVEPGGPQ